MTLAVESARETGPLTPALWIGTSGWVYPHWMDGVFYPEGLRGDELLPYYAERYSTVEVNFSFYRLPERPVFESWRAHTPPDFLFAVKASRFLTHMKKLKDPEEPMQRLMDRASGLREKLGPILFQLPPRWPVNLDRLRHFLQVLKDYPGHRWTLEFRHQSWFTPKVYRLLEDAGIALCIPVSPSLPIDIRLTAPWTYIRMHGGPHPAGAFTDDELAWWADHVSRFRREGADVYVYFNNDWEGNAIWNSMRLRELLEE